MPGLVPGTEEVDRLEPLPLERLGDEPAVAGAGIALGAAEGGRRLPRERGEPPDPRREGGAPRMRAVAALPETAEFLGEGDIGDPLPAQRRLEGRPPEVEEPRRIGEPADVGERADPLRGEEREELRSRPVRRPDRVDARQLAWGSSGKCRKDAPAVRSARCQSVSGWGSKIHSGRQAQATQAFSLISFRSWPSPQPE